MGNNSKQDQGETTRMTDYERRKMLRVQENQERLRELGIKKIANSLTSLVDSQKTKKTRKKSAAISETNVGFSHDHNGETGEDYREEVAASVEAPKKQLRTQFIAPLSMNKFSNLIKHRIVAPNVSRVLPSEEGCDGPETFANSNAAKKSRLQQCKEANERNEQCIDGSAANKNQSRAKVTMGELVLNKKGSQRHSGQKEAKPNSTTTSTSHALPSEEGCDGLETFPNSSAAKKSSLQQCKEANGRNEQFIGRSAANKNQSRAKVTIGELVLNKKGSQRHSGQNAAKPNSATSTSSGSRKQLSLMDEEDEDDVRSQDVNEREREEVSSEDAVNEDIEDDFRSHDVNDADIENYGVEDDENENIEPLFDHSDNEIEDDGSEDDFENDDVELEILQVPQSQKQTAISTTKKRGPTMMHNIHTRNLREAIICNEFGQHIGPVTEEKDIVGKFSRFLGTIARTYSYAPLIYNSWHKVPNKDRMWEYVLEKYIVPGDAKPWVLMTIGACWRGHKSRLKKKHFYGLKDNSSRLKNRPKCIPEKDFLQLLRLWNKTEEKKRCLAAKARRMSQKNLHTAGPKSFARIREDMKNEDPNKEPPSLTKLFERTRERKEGHVYADTYNETESLIEKMKNYQAPEEEDGGGQDVSGPVDPFLAVMNKEYNGHRRLFGKGVTNKLIKKVNGGETSYMVPTELMESVKTAIDAEIKWLVEIRKQIEDDHERKKLELAEEHKKNKAEIEEMRKEMRKEIDDQRDRLVEDAVQMLIEKLPPGVVKKFLV